MGKDGQPCNTLWISFAPSSHIDEQMIRSTLISFGQIKSVKTFSSRNLVCVEFTTVDDAQRAKESLGGQVVLNDPRIKPHASVNENPFRPLKNHPIAQGFEPFISPPAEFSDVDTLHRMLPSTVKGTNKHPTTSIECFQRDSKRPKIGGNLLNNNASFPLKNNADDGHGSRQEPHHNHIWHGIIAKGGTTVCHARCVAYGKGLGIELPRVVDCIARTELDMLARHYADAIGFDIVFFLPDPDSEDDFASYIEFLEYLKVNNRAGVAKFADDTNFFLVPPDFLTKILKVTAPEHIYGVVFKFPTVPSRTPMKKTTHLSASPSIGYMHRTPSLQAECDLIPTKEKQTLPMDYNTKLPLKPPHPATTEPPSIHSLPSNYPTKTLSAPKASVAFTP